MLNLLYLATLLAVSVSGFAHAVSPTPNRSSVEADSDCPAVGWCRSSACHAGKAYSECTDSCVYLADQCCTFCFQTFGAEARTKCIGQCSFTVHTQLEKPVSLQRQHPESKQSMTVDKPSISRAALPSKRKIRPTPMQQPKITTVHTAVAGSQHLLSRQHQSSQHHEHGDETLAKQPPPATVAPPAQCQHCQMTSHADECQIQCTEMHEACTTNCVVLYADPSDRQPCLQHCISLVVVHSQRAFQTPPPGFDVIEATHITPPPGPELPKVLPPIPRSSPQAAKAANALKEAGQKVPDNVGLRLRHHTLNTRPTLTLTVF